MDDALTPVELQRLEQHLDAVRDTHVEPLRVRPTYDMRDIYASYVLVDALAQTYSATGSNTDKWRRFADRYLPTDPAISQWYGEARSRGLHNLSAGQGIEFLPDTADPRLHGAVSSGGTAVHVSVFRSDAIRAYEQYRNDVLQDEALGRLALRAFDAQPPVRGVRDPRFVGEGAQSASAAPAPTPRPARGSGL